jgi:hypothetical protein
MITVCNITSAGAVYDYVFGAENTRDFDAVKNLTSCYNYEWLTQAAQDADMLRDGPVKDIGFRYFHLHKASLEHPPHLFVDRSPLLILATIFQESSSIDRLLDVHGAVLMPDINTLVTQLLRSIGLLYGGTGHAGRLSRNCWVHFRYKDRLVVARRILSLSDAGAFAAIVLQLKGKACITPIYLLL